MRYDKKIGFVVLDAVLSPNETETIVKECDKIRSGPETDIDVGDKLYGGTVHLKNLATRIGLVRDLATRPEILEVVTEIVGSEPFLAQSSFRCPRPGFGSQKLHSDDAPKLDDGPCRVATALVPLVSFVGNNGGTRVLPGSHLRPDLQPKAGSLENHADEVVVTAAAGSVIVFSGHLLHSGRTNESDQERPALQFLWHRQS